VGQSAGSNVNRKQRYLIACTVSPQSVASTDNRTISPSLGHDLQWCHNFTLGCMLEMGFVILPLLSREPAAGPHWGRIMRSLLRGTSFRSEAGEVEGNRGNACQFIEVVIRRQLRILNL
jgi:hypothetical protein